VCQKTYNFYFYDNLSKRGLIFIFFSLLNSERICGKKELKLRPPHYSFTAHLFQSDEKRLIMVNVHEGCNFFIFYMG